MDSPSASNPGSQAGPGLPESYFRSDRERVLEAMLRVAALQKQHPHLSPLKMLESQLLAEMGKAQEAETKKMRAIVQAMQPAQPAQPRPAPAQPRGAPPVPAPQPQPQGLAPGLPQGTR